MKFWQVDAFTNTCFKGNPAAVFVLDHQLEDALMQKIASEMNLPETAFVYLRENKNPFLRWFTPVIEMDLCGHATLSAAHILFTELSAVEKKLTFDTKCAGPLAVEKKGHQLMMNFPSRTGKHVELQSIPSFVLKALSPARPICARESRDLLLVYENEEAIYQMAPNFSSLSNYDRDVIVTAPSSHHKYDFVSRFFCPKDSVVEDPVTGSAHCTLAPFWAGELNKNKLFAYQASERGGELELALRDNRVYITGEALTVIHGELLLK